MRKKLVFIIFCIFLFTACSNNLNNQQVSDNNFKKLNSTISIIKNYYLEEIPQEIFQNNNSKDYTEEVTTNKIKNIMEELDKYSVYLNTTNRNIISEENILEKSEFKIIDNRILYINISYFYKNIAYEISNIISNNKNMLKGLILDLRNNPGGLLKEAIETVNLFVDKGDIISIKQKNINSTRTYRANSQKTITDIPIVVLINKNTASSAEIVSGALKDLNRATLIGTETFGKRTIQALIYISKNKKEAINLTIAKYYFPNKKRDDKIQPDILVIDSQIQYAIKYLHKLL